MNTSRTILVEARLSKISSEELAAIVPSANEIVTEVQAGPSTATSREHHQVVLIPGCFGFGSLGDLSYFNGVREALAESLSLIHI